MNEIELCEICVYCLGTKNLGFFSQNEILRSLKSTSSNEKYDCEFSSTFSEDEFQQDEKSRRRSKKMDSDKEYDPDSSDFSQSTDIDEQQNKGKLYFTRKTHSKVGFSAGRIRDKSQNRKRRATVHIVDDGDEKSYHKRQK